MISREPYIPKQLRNKIMSAEKASEYIQDGMTVAMSGSASSGYPKDIPKQLVSRKHAGDAFQIDLLTSSFVAPLDNTLGGARIIRKRSPILESRTLSGLVNQGEVSYLESQIGDLPHLFRHGFFGEIDVAVVEALTFTEEGWLIPTSSVGYTASFVELAESVIVEVNAAQPDWLMGLHDIFLPGSPPEKVPIPLRHTGQRIGDAFIRIDPAKIRGIVYTNAPDVISSAHKRTPEGGLIAENLLLFLQREIKDRGYRRLPPLQTGFGAIASEVVRGFNTSEFTDIEFFSGAAFEGHIELFQSGKVKAISTSSLQITPKVSEILSAVGQDISRRIVLRNADITNAAETAGRMGLIALNSGIEVDVYGNVNSSHVMGCRVVNGIGGGANFAQSAELSVLLIPSTAKNGDISTIVPMVSHHDIVEHDVDIVITENGVADLRGKDDFGRASCLIKNCAGGVYKDMLLDFLDRAAKQTGGHHPQLLREAFSWHIRFQETGTMRL